MGKGGGGKGSRQGRGGGASAEVTDQQMKDDFNGENLSKDEQEALNAYQGIEYQIINTYLRDGREAAIDLQRDFERGNPTNLSSVQKTIRALDSATNRGLRQNTTLYRTIERGDAFDLSLTPGSTFKDRGFTSTTIDGNVAARGSRGRTVIEIQAPKGTKGMYMPANPGRNRSYDAGKEFLLHRGNTYRVVSRTQNSDGSTKIVVEIV